MLIILLDSAKKTPLQQWYFPSENVIKIGRSSDNEIIIDHPLVSRQHLELIPPSVSVSSWRLINKGTNGTFVNGNLTPESLIKNGDLIQLAPDGPLLTFQESASRFFLNCSHAGNPTNNLFCIHCGQPIKIEKTVRQYQILKILGQGGMGTTYMAWDREKANQSKEPPSAFLIVLKEMNADMEQIEKARELFEREAEILRKLNHPGIPKFFDFFVEKGKKYLAMEMLHGQDLEKIIYQKGPVNLAQAITWMQQTCEVLDYLHSQNRPIIHRDIKPANLLARYRDNHIIVLDFGAVKEIGTPPGTRIGVEGYMAPEQERGQPTTQSDLYAIGPSLIFLLTGDIPQKYSVIKGNNYVLELERIPTITPKLRKVIEKVTKSNPKERYQTAKELAKALGSVI